MVSRIYIGGLPPDINIQDLAQRFASFGKVIDCEIIPDKSYHVMFTNTTDIFKRNFGYVSIEPKDEGTLKKALHLYNGSKWRNSVLRVGLAKPTAMERLKQESEEEIAKAEAEQQQKQEASAIHTIQDGTVLNIKNPDRKAMFSRVTIGGPPPTLLTVSDYVTVAATATPKEKEKDKNDGGDVAVDDGEKKKSTGAIKRSPLPTVAEERKKKKVDRHTVEVVPKKEGVNERQAIHIAQLVADKMERKKTNNNNSSARTHNNRNHRDYTINDNSSDDDNNNNTRQQLYTQKDTKITTMNTTTNIKSSTTTQKKTSQYQVSSSSSRPSTIHTADFMTDEDKNQMNKSTIDLSRFGGDSSDSDDGGGGGGVNGRRRMNKIPQVDGADDSSSDSGDNSDSDSSEENTNNDTTATSSSDTSNIDDNDNNDDDDEQDKHTHNNNNNTTTSKQQQVLPSWMHSSLPAGSQFYRKEPLVQIEGSWRASRDTAVRNYKERRRQSMRQSSGGVKK